MAISGAVYFPWTKKIAPHYGFSTDHDVVCGPCTVNQSEFNREGPCCFNHPTGHASHAIPVVKGKPFDVRAEYAYMSRKGMLEVRSELLQERKDGAKPPGTAVKKNGVLTYPARHFA